MPKKYILPLLLLLQIVLVRILALFPVFVEKAYSNGLYQYLSKNERLFFGWIPFSLGDVIYGVAIFGLLRWFWKKRRSWKSYWKDNLLRICSFLCVFYFLFNLLWAMNYHRVKLPQKLGITTDYSEPELVAFTQKLIAKTNAIQLQITRDSTARVVVPYSQLQVFEMDREGYLLLSREYPFFAPGRLGIKKSLISLPLTYMGFSGYLNPFTNEAQVNDMIPAYSFPSVSCHEMAHQIGYASESEANFIGFLAAIHNRDNYIRYSGYTMAVRYCFHSLQLLDKKKALSLSKTVNPGIRKNFLESQQFWDDHQTFIEEGFKVFYDNFLKMNRQDEGLESYNRFVDLMVNYYKKQPI
jgi:hypothetical protein